MRARVLAIGRVVHVLFADRGDAAMQAASLIFEPVPIRAFSEDFLSAFGQWPDFERPPQTRQERDIPLP